MESFLTHLLRVLIQLGVAAVLGGLVGLEREAANRPAGLRTHLLVCVGSALIMQVSMNMYDMVLASGGGVADPGRIAAQVVSGIGFLGAGTIMREGLSIRGLTTAASLWVVAGVGLAVGAGMYVEALVVGVMVVLTLRFLSAVEDRFIAKGNHHTIAVQVADTPGQLGSLASAIGRRGANIKNVRMRGGPVPGTVDITFYLKLPPRAAPSGLIADLLTLEGVIQVTEEE